MGMPKTDSRCGSTGDIIFITRNAVQFVTTKGMHLQDYAHYPYCLAHPAIPCPTGQYSTVGGIYPLALGHSLRAHHDV